MKRTARAGANPDPCAAGENGPRPVPPQLDPEDIAEAADRAVRKALGDRERIAPLTLEPMPGDLTLSVCHEIITEVIWEDHEIGDVLESHSLHIRDWSRALRRLEVRSMIDEVVGAFSRIQAAHAIRELAKQAKDGNAKSAKDLLTVFAKLNPPTRTAAQIARHRAKVADNLASAEDRKKAAADEAERLLGESSE